MLIYNRLLRPWVPIIIWEGNQYHECTDYDPLSDWQWWNYPEEDGTLPLPYADTGAVVSDKTGIGPTGTRSAGCFQTAEHPQGVEMWKSTVFHFWRLSMTPLGHGWTLSPEFLKRGWSREKEWEDEKGAWMELEDGMGKETEENRYIGKSCFLSRAVSVY